MKVLFWLLQDHEHSLMAIMLKAFWSVLRIVNLIQIVDDYEVLERIQLVSELHEVLI